MSVKAIQYAEFGGELKLVDLPKPKPGPHQLLVKVKNAAVNPIDYKLWKKLVPYETKLPFVPGMDVSGVVEEVGTEVDPSKFEVGSEVHALSRPKWENQAPIGSFAEYTLVEDVQIALKPKSMGFPEAAAIPLAAKTSYQALQSGGIKKGSKVLILGGSSATGLVAVRLAKNVFGASLVVATSSTRNVEFVNSLGSDRIIDYTKEDWSVVLKEQDFDIVYDTVGEKDSFHRAKDVIKSGGYYVTIVGAAPSDEVKKATPYHFHRTVAQSAGADLEKLDEYWEAGKLKIFIDSTYPLAEVAEAFKKSESGRSVGKIVISVS